MKLLRLRWSLRDARRRWIQIVGIAFTIAVGIGSYAGLGSVTDWRLASIDKSLGITRMYDLRATVSAGEHVQAGSLERLASEIGGVADHSERLVFDTQVELEIEDEERIVHGRVVGMDLSVDDQGIGAQVVNEAFRIEGAPVPQTGTSPPQVLLEGGFAAFYDLPTSGAFTVGGDVDVEYVGQALSPEYFLIVEGHGSLGKSNLAVMFAPLETAQHLSDRSGEVNDLVLTLEPGTDPDAVREQLIEAAQLEGTLLDVMTREETPSYAGLIGAPKVDENVSNVFAILLFAGAAFATLNFTSRMVGAQRREIGASMALGEMPRSIGVRPLLIGLQIGVLGAILGVLVGYGISLQSSSVFQRLVPLPVFEQPFQTSIYGRAMVIGFLVPMIAVAWPVFRAVRVRPVEAIRSGHLASRGGGLSPVISRLPLPGRSLGKMPFRNLMRAPRRTFLTLLTLTLSLAILFSQVGLVSTFIATFEHGDEELLGDEPERFIVRLDTLYPIGSEQVRDVIDDSTTSDAEPGLVLGAHVAAAAPGAEASEGIDLVVRFVDFGSRVWTPTLSEGAMSGGEPGIVLAQKAAQDFGVEVGDEVVVTHPVLQDEKFTYETQTVPVSAIHGHPLRINTYMDIGAADDWGLAGLANIVTGVPAEGSDLNDIKRSLFGTGTGVTLVQGLGESFRSVRDSLEQSQSIFILTRLFGILLVMLIAFNSANISVDERTRDHATMFAYGVPVRRVVANLSLEGLLLGVAAVILGGLFGYALLLWIALDLMPTAIPEVGMVLSVRWLEMAAYFAAALAAIAVAPTFPGRKLKSMFIPGKLRVME